MKRHAVLASLALAAACPVHAADADVRQLDWLAGCWKAVADEPGSGEMWMPAAAGTLMGMSRTVRGGRVSSWEFMRIAQEGGTLVFHAQPGGKPADSFPAIRMEAGQVVFENLQHPFPQRIVYARGAGGRLDARIEGERNGQPRVIAYPMERVGCETLGAPG